MQQIQRNNMGSAEPSGERGMPRVTSGEFVRVKCAATVRCGEMRAAIGEAVYSKPEKFCGRQVGPGARSHQRVAHVLPNDRYMLPEENPKALRVPPRKRSEGSSVLYASNQQVRATGERHVTRKSRVG